jgi:[FeFe] hydrogenase H-cluster maturation GTPase HydF
MEKTPKSLRIQIGIFGRTNVGKSSFLNMITGQDISIISEIAGTTTDVVEKPMELLPIGPVLFLDTAGLDDTSELSLQRIKKTEKIFDRADVFVVIIEPNIWTEYEEKIVEIAKSKNVNVIIVINKCDIVKPKEDFINLCKDKSVYLMQCCSNNKAERDIYVTEFKKMLLMAIKLDNERKIVSDLVSKNGFAILIIPIDKEAPKGRIILPQVQTIRELLDNGSAALVVREQEYPVMLEKIKSTPDLVVCDSQVVDKMVFDTPKHIKCTTFSILFSKFKGDLKYQAFSTAKILLLKDGDRVLIAEACTHHAIEDDIGRVKIPALLKEFTKKNIKIEIASGRDYPDNLSDYSLIIHCGSCMLTKRETIARINKAKEKNIPITNYGLCISFLKGVLERVLEPFPEALKAYNSSKNSLEQENNLCKQKY